MSNNHISTSNYVPTSVSTSNHVPVSNHVLTPSVKSILSHYAYENTEVKNNLERLLNTGKLGGTGKLLILPVDQGFEHGPVASFITDQSLWCSHSKTQNTVQTPYINPYAYDPEYHIQLAIDAGLSAYAAPVGALNAITYKYGGHSIPLILKINSSNALCNKHDQAITSSIEDALRLGCVGIGFTIYPGSDNIIEMLEELQKLSSAASKHGLFTVVWSYPRGANMPKEAETALDTISYATHIAALVGAHIIKVKLPTEYVTQEKYIPLLEPYNTSLAARISQIMRSAFCGKRLVLFSGGAAKVDDDLITEATAIKQGGGSGSMIGRNVFQRPKENALIILQNIIERYKENTAS